MTSDLTSRWQTVETKFGRLAVRANGDWSLPPLVLCQRFRGTMTGIRSSSRGLPPAAMSSASTAPGIGESKGETPATVASMAKIVSALLDALKLGRVDLLGWSLGG
jgi:pimeloyl-ACP methyl ester carboxylesterase